MCLANSFEIACVMIMVVNAFICHENEMIKDNVHKQLNSPFQNLSPLLTSILDLLIIHNGIHLVPSLVLVEHQAPQLRRLVLRHVAWVGQVMRGVG